MQIGPEQRDKENRACNQQQPGDLPLAQALAGVHLPSSPGLML